MKTLTAYVFNYATEWLVRQGARPAVTAVKPSTKR